MIAACAWQLRKLLLEFDRKKKDKSFERLRWECPQERPRSNRSNTVPVRSDPGIYFLWVPLFKMNNQNAQAAARETVVNNCNYIRSNVKDNEDF